MKQVLQFVERVFWVGLLAFVGALSAPEIAEFFGNGLSVTAENAAYIAGTTAVLREIVAVGQSRISVLPNPGNVPTPVTDKIEG